MVDPEHLADIVAQAIDVATLPLLTRIETLEREKSASTDALAEYRRAIDSLTGEVTALKAAQPQVDVIAAKAASLVPPARDGRDAAPVDVDAIVLKVAARFQPPKDGRDGKDAEPVDVDVIAAKAASLIQKPLDGRDGKDGRDGVSLTLLDVQPLVIAEVNKAVAVIEKPRDGKDAEPVDLDLVARKAAALVPKPQDGKDAPPVDLDAIAVKAAALIPAPKDGKDAAVDLDALAVKAAALVPPPKDGRDGKDIDAEVVKAMVVNEVNKGIQEGRLSGPMGPRGPEGARGERGERGEQGIPGEKGEAGASVDVEQVQKTIAAEVQKAVAAIELPKDGVGISSAVIDHEGVLILSLTDGTTKSLGCVVGKAGRDGLPGVPGRSGQDGIDGKPGAPGAPGKNGIDGKDGIGFDDLDLVIDEATKSAVIRFRKGDVVKEFPLPFPMHWGIYSDSETYRKGNVVTRGGSMWMAILDSVKGIQPDDKTAQKAWRLVVQRGKPGSEGKRGPQGEPGRDLRWEDRG